MEMVCSYVCGLMQVNYINGNRYFVTFIVDHSRKLWMYQIKRIYELLEVFKKLKSTVERRICLKMFWEVL